MNSGGWVMSSELGTAFPEGWKRTTVGAACDSGGDVQTGPFGSQLHASDYVVDGVPVVMPQDIAEDCIAIDRIARVRRSDAERLDRYRLRVGDVVYSRRGDVERRALVSDAEAGWLCGTGCLRVRVTNALVDQRFLYYYLGEPSVRAWIVRHALGATMPNLNTAILQGVPLVLPPIAEQRRIAAVLGALDDKIELNRRMSRTLEEIAQTIFKAWFIDFDGCDDLVESELGPIPRGWSVGRVTDLAFVNPEVWTTKSAPVSIRYLDLANVKWGDLGDPLGVTFDDAPSRARRVLRHGDTIIGLVRPANGSYGLVLSPPDGLTGSTGFAVVRPRRPELTLFNYLWLTRRAFIDHLATVADGCAYPAVRPEVIANAPIPLPDASILDRLHQVAAPVFERREVCREESRTLAALRDLLLPKLISGELRVPEAEKAVEAVT